MKKIFLCILLAIVANGIYAQTGRQVRGVVKDSTQQSVISATVKLISATDTLKTVTNIDGVFTFQNVKSSTFVISISSLGYADFVRKYLYAEGTTPIQL